MIDWSRADDLRNEIGEEDFIEVVEMFLDEMQEEIIALRIGAQPATLEGKLHFLKGSALNLGFEGFATLCHAGERAAAEGRQDSVDLACLLQVYEQSKAAFLTRLEDDFAA